jgi:site-specific DNA recombinase
VPVKPRFDSPQNATLITQDDLERTPSHPSGALPTIVADSLDLEGLASLRAVFRSRNKPQGRYGTLEFPYRGLLTCAYDNCMITAEIKKNRYTYYRCTGYRGKCALPYLREEALSDRLGQILRDIHIPDRILDQLQKSLIEDSGREDMLRQQQTEKLNDRLALVLRRMDQAYQDKLDEKISEDFWLRKSAEWQAEEQQIRTSLQALIATRPERLLEASKILELANKAYFLYVKQNHSEKAKLLKTIVSNCAIDAVSLYPTYRKPFDLIFQRAKREEWRAR